MLAVGSVALYAFVGGNNIPVNTMEDTESRDTTSVSQTENDDSTVDTEIEVTAGDAPIVSAVFDSYDRTVSRAAVTMRKAGLDEYDLVVETVKATETTAPSKKTKKTGSKGAEKTVTDNSSEAEKDLSETTTASAKKKSKSKKNTKSKKTTTVTEAQTEDIETLIDDLDEMAESAFSVKSSQNSLKDISASEPQSEVKACAAKTLYSMDKVNLRTDASLNADVIEVLPIDAEVIVTGYTEDWYRVKFDGKSGYCMKKYFTSDIPVVIEEEVHSSADVISYNDTEFDMLCYVLQGEVGNCSEASKIAVANVIINRVKDPRFPDSISGVLTQPEQFDAIYGYYGGYTVPSENTIECAKRALAGEDNTNGAIYYYAPQYVGGGVASWFESLQLCLELDGQRYFK